MLMKVIVVAVIVVAVIGVVLFMRKIKRYHIVYDQR